MVMNYDEIAYSYEMVQGPALPNDLREKLRNMAAEHMQALSDRLINSMWPKPATSFEETVWPPKPTPRCACGKCYGLINTCGATS